MSQVLKSIVIVSGLLCCSGLLTPNASAAPLVLFDTGVDGSGNPLGDAAVDTHYRVTRATGIAANGSPTGVEASGITPTTINNASIVALAGAPAFFQQNDLTAGGYRWINTGSPAGNINAEISRWFFFEQTFNIGGGGSIESASLSGQATADNALHIYLNGNLLASSFNAGVPPANPGGGNAAANFVNFSTSNISFFRGGSNTLTFAVWNNVGETGLVVRNLMGDAVAVPELNASTALIPLFSFFLLSGLLLDRRCKVAG